MSKNKKNGLPREQQESAEGLTQMTNEQVPSDRFQNTQQIPNAQSSTSVTTDPSSFQTKEMKRRGNAVKQTKVSEAVTTLNGVGGEIPSENSGIQTLSYSGNEGSVLGAASQTPIVGQSTRSDSRLGKKYDATAKKINFIAPELVVEHYDESKPLAESADLDQGYNGTYRNQQARAQKNNDAVPGSNNFQRGIDEIKRDQLYFSTGQVVNVEGVRTYDTPTAIPEKQANGAWVYPLDDNGNVEANYALTRGNYLHRNMIIRVKDGKLIKMKFTVDDISTTLPADGSANMSSASAVIDRNTAEINRQAMDAKAGDEQYSSYWSPLPRAIKQPSQTIAYLRDIENITGSEVWLAYKKTAACMSYQLNRAAKDGKHSKRPMREAAYGLLFPEDSSIYFSSQGYDDIFNSDLLKKGASSLFIALFDSQNKYSTKADLILQPRAYRLALQTADNNMNVLRLKPDLAAVINNREVFSTIDRDYDPLMPVCVSDKSALIHCYNFNDLYSFDSLDENDNPVFSKPVFKYSYSDARNNYLTTAALPLLQGIHIFLDEMAAKIGSINNRALEDVDIVIPMIHSTCYFSLWSLLVLQSTPKILDCRVNSMRDVLAYQSHFDYPFTELKMIKDVNPMNAVNYKNDSYDQPLVIQQMHPATALSWVMPELFWPIKEHTADDTYEYVLPWYVNEEQFRAASGNVEFDSSHSVMTMPSIRDGIRLGFADMLYSMSEKDIRLSMDCIAYFEGYDSASYRVYKYSQISDGIPVLKWAASDFTNINYMKLPRQLSWFMVAPYGILSTESSQATFDSSTIASFSEGTDPFLGQYSYKVKYWFGKGLKLNSSILQPAEVNVSRSESFMQDWNGIYCYRHATNAYSDPGFLLSIGDCFRSNGKTISGKSAFIPFTNGIMNGGAEETETDESYTIFSLQKAIWARIQKLPFVLSPWDAMSTVRAAGEDSPHFDLFDLFYYFGCAGFRASDYRESVYNRLNSVDTMGLLFTKDPWVQDSPIFKESYRATQV